MKKFVLAAFALLAISAGSAFAAQPVVNHLGQVMNGPNYGADVSGG